jgi:hypothetical protein
MKAFWNLARKEITASRVATVCFVFACIGDAMTNQNTRLAISDGIIFGGMAFANYHRDRANYHSGRYRFHIEAVIASEKEIRRIEKRIAFLQGTLPPPDLPNLDGLDPRVVECLSSDSFHQKWGIRMYGFFAALSIANAILYVKGQQYGPAGFTTIGTIGYSLVVSNAARILRKNRAELHPHP